MSSRPGWSTRASSRTASRAIEKLCLKTNKQAGEMAQRLRALVVLPKGPEFNSQQPHGGSQPSVVRSGTPFWTADVHAD